VASNVAAIATGSDAGKKVLSGLEAEGKKVLSETATRMLDHAKKQGLTQVSDTGRQLLAQVVG
jgi:predicted ATPase